jgi:hypothetical protein
MSQSTDDLTRSELRAIRGHYSCTTSPGARRWSAWRRGPPGRGQPGTPAVAVPVEVRGGKEQQVTRYRPRA